MNRLSRAWAWLTTSNVTVAQMKADHLHLPSLDGSRAVSILFVLFAHYVSKRYFPGGVGVQIFFVISGLLITRLMLAERKETGAFDIPDFLLRRAFRLLPILFVCCALVSAAMLIFTPTKFDWKELLATLLYVENYFTTWRQALGIPRTMPFTPFWSLSVEEQFYIGFAFVAWWMGNSPKRILWLATIATIVPLFIRLYYAITWPALLGHNSIFIYAHTETRINSIATGMMVAAACELREAVALFGS